MEESASHATGSLLIWDTGEYEVMDRPTKRKTLTTDDELSDNDKNAVLDNPSQSSRIFAAFQSRHIHLRLHGSRLPKGYTIALRLPRQDNSSKSPSKPRSKRRRLDPVKATALAKQRATADQTDSDSSARTESTLISTGVEDDAALASEGEAKNTAQDTWVRANNAYPGADNSINSIHQRHWFLTLDRKYSGFHKARPGSEEEGRWVGGFEPFFVKGREHERSAVTGRKADEVMADEGVERFVGRKMWRPIME
ncbi:hypothetical protein LTR62_007101 [Meristemomyces frigidus]|uniref:DNA ligase D 3'-phosphoesterase domain-containing protein n=1 Tax=Meristemomyces frigidus TaxID=1508187 RepID=A0AAN7TBJ2_9PEZI|nr:hypothetical protein LTR62_007101 [Meristemomyces frigidus]